MNIRNVEELNESEAYILINSVFKNEENEEVIVKELLNVNSISPKQDLISLEQQNTKLVGIIQSMLKRLTDIEQRLSNINTSKEEQPSDIMQILESIQEKLDSNILE